MQLFRHAAFDAKLQGFTLSVSGGAIVRPVRNLRILGVEFDAHLKFDNFYPNPTEFVIHPTTTPDHRTDESYTLVASNGIVDIYSGSFFGARHALETLNQLVAYNSYSNTFRMPRTLNITDRPAYSHRGLLIDTSRHYLPLGIIRNIVVAMGHTKMNVLHWHLTDAASFPYKSTLVPEMSEYGAYSPSEVYTQQDLKQMRLFAAQHGVWILLELDTPAHVALGWQWGPEKSLGNLATCIEVTPYDKYSASPPAGQINPINPHVLDILEKLYREFGEALNPKMFHMGGDEFYTSCWKDDPEILQHVRSRKLNESAPSTYDRLWFEYQEKNLARFYRSVTPSAPIVLWSSHTTDSDTVTSALPPSQYIIQFWSKHNSKGILRLVKKGYKVIDSSYDKWYLDCGYGHWITNKLNWCAPLKTWQVMYEYSPRLNLIKNAEVAGETISKTAPSQILGGEVAMWGEQVDADNIETRVWPRAMAAAGRLWAEPTGDWTEAQERFFAQIQRLKQLGIPVDPIKPDYCYKSGQNMC